MLRLHVIRVGGGEFWGNAARLPLGVGRRSGKRKDRKAGEDSGAFVRKLMSRAREWAIFRGLEIGDDDQSNSRD